MVVGLRFISYFRQKSGVRTQFYFHRGLLFQMLRSSNSNTAFFIKQIMKAKIPLDSSHGNCSTGHQQHLEKFVRTPMKSPHAMARHKHLIALVIKGKL